MTTLTNITMTADELYGTPIDGPCELVKGRLMMMTPAGHWHGSIESSLILLVGEFVKRNRLGKVYGGDTGFQIESDPDTVRAPDVAFVRNERKPASKLGFFKGPPDLAVEIVSFNDGIREVEEKARCWITADARLVWVVWPKTRTITVLRPGTEPHTLTEADKLHGEDVLPGFECPVAEVFAE